MTSALHSRLLKNWGKKFIIQFTIFVHSQPKDEIVVNILHITNGKNGYSVPAVYLFETKFKIHMKIPGYEQIFPFPCQFNQTHTIVLIQERMPSGDTEFVIKMDGQMRENVPVPTPTTIDNLSLYLSDPWKPSVNEYARISKLTISNCP